MVISREHIPFYRNIFQLPNLLSDPLLVFGYHDINETVVQIDFRYKDLGEFLTAKGLKNITILDLFDERADLRYDFNFPVPDCECEKYHTLIDIGCLEHLFDTKQCLENCMKMIKPKGFYFLVTPVNGYYDHGLYTFNPELILEAFKLNGFEIIYQQYSSRMGHRLKKPNDAINSLIWLVGKKTASIKDFRIPQQKIWEKAYASEENKTITSYALFEFHIRRICPTSLFTIFIKGKNFLKYLKQLWD